MLALYIPERYAELFKDLVDYYVVPAKHVCDTYNYPANLMIDATDLTTLDDILDTLTKCDPAWVILPSKPRAEDHLLQTSQYLTKLRDTYPQLSIMAQWLGHAKIKDILLEYLDGVCIPSSKPRGYYFDKSMVYPRQFWYYESSSLDHLRRTKPYGLIAKIPIAAALRSIDLASRDRRPKIPLDFPWDVKLTIEQTELALLNAQYLKEALAWDGIA